MIIALSPKKGVINNTYVIVGAAGYKIGKNSDKEAAIRFRDHDNPNELEDYRVKGLYVTNSVYAYSSMKEGTGYYGEEENIRKQRLIQTYYLQL